MKKPKPEQPPADPNVEKKIKETATFMADMIQQSPPTVQVAAAAVLLSSLVIITVRPGKRISVLEKLVADMRGHINHANAKKTKAAPL